MTATGAVFERHTFLHYVITSMAERRTFVCGLDRMAFFRAEAARLRGNVGCAMGAQSHRFGTVAQTH